MRRRPDAAAKAAEHAPRPQPSPAPAPAGPLGAPESGTRSRSSRQNSAPAAAVSRRTLALVLLCVQNASVSILTRLSRTARAPVLYNPAAAVFTAELVKAALSLAVLAAQRHRDVRATGGEPSSLVTQAGAAIADLMRNQRREQLHLAVPAALYALQNTLLASALRVLP